MPGFSFRYRIGGGAPTVQKVVFKDTETLTKGDMVNLESGQADLGATADTNLMGVAQQTLAGTSAVTKIEVITDPDAVYGVADANARKVGDTLDLAGATGAQTVAASTNKEFVVVADSTATQETLVRINVGKHYQNKAQ
jgi:methionine aminopeptidase